MVAVQSRLLSVKEFKRMGEVGIFHEDEHVELIKGEIVKMSPIGSKHSGTVMKLIDFIQKQNNGDFFVWPQNPLILQAETYLEPDLVILNYRKDYYVDSHPTEKDVRLVIEVSESSLQYDQNLKLPLYAEAGIAEVWVVNLVSKEVEIYVKPENNKYLEAIHHKKGKSIKSIHGIELDLDFILS